MFADTLGDARVTWGVSSGARRNGRDRRAARRAVPVAVERLEERMCLNGATLQVRNTDKFQKFFPLPPIPAGTLVEITATFAFEPPPEDPDSVVPPSLVVGTDIAENWHILYLDEHTPPTLT